MAKIQTALDEFKPDPRLEDDRGATAERMGRAGDEFHRSDVGLVTMRDSPLERAHGRKALFDKYDADANDRRYRALAKFRHHWFNAGLNGSMSTIDPNHIFASDISSFSGMAKTEAQVFHRQRYRQGVEALGVRRSYVVEWAVCRESPLEKVGQGLGWTNKAQAIAAATELLKDGGDVLSTLWAV